jgi:hypothetical protein
LPKTYPNNTHNIYFRTKGRIKKKPKSRLIIRVTSVSASASTSTPIRYTDEEVSGDPGGEGDQTDDVSTYYT